MIWLFTKFIPFFSFEHVKEGAMRIETSKGARAVVQEWIWVRAMSLLNSIASAPQSSNIMELHPQLSWLHALGKEIVASEQAEAAQEDSVLMRVTVALVLQTQKTVS